MFVFSCICSDLSALQNAQKEKNTKDDYRASPWSIRATWRPEENVWVVFVQLHEFRTGTLHTFFILNKRLKTLGADTGFQSHLVSVCQKGSPTTHVWGTSVLSWRNTWESFLIHGKPPLIYGCMLGQHVEKKRQNTWKLEVKSRILYSRCHIWTLAESTLCPKTWLGPEWAAWGLVPAP